MHSRSASTRQASATSAPPGASGETSAFGLLASVQFTLILATSVLNTVLPDIQHDFDLGRGELALLGASYGMSFSGVLPRAALLGAGVLLIGFVITEGRARTPLLIRGCSALRTSAAFFPFGLTLAVCGLCVGRLVGRFWSRAVLVTGLCVAVCAFVVTRGRAGGRTG